MVLAAVSGVMARLQTYLNNLSDEQIEEEGKRNDQGQPESQVDELHSEHIRTLLFSNNFTGLPTSAGLR